MKQRKGTYYEIDEISKRLDKLEKTIEEFMSNWGPEIQRKREEDRKNILMIVVGGIILVAILSKVMRK